MVSGIWTRSKSIKKVMLQYNGCCLENNRFLWSKGLKDGLKSKTFQVYMRPQNTILVIITTIMIIVIVLLNNLIMMTILMIRLRGQCEKDKGREGRSVSSGEMSTR